MDSLDAIFRAQHGRAMASLIRVLGDWQLAEDALMDASVAALQRWPEQGVPRDPLAWLLTVARRAGIDRVRRGQTRRDKADRVRDDVLLRAEERALSEPDDPLRLLFTCCHPALSPEARVALTLSTVCGLSVEAIARAFLVPKTTMAQRLVRSKRKIRDAAIPYRVPDASERGERLPAVLRVLYLLFNEGYASSQGDALVLERVCVEAIAQAELLEQASPHPEVTGLLCLMRLHHARRATRVDDDGVATVLEEQDRAQWDHATIAAQRPRLVAAATTGPVGPYQLQAHIALAHAAAPSFAETDWRYIERSYRSLRIQRNTAVVALNHAVAIAFVAGWQRGLDAMQPLASALADQPLFHAARADLLRRLERDTEAIVAYRRALSLTRNSPEQRFLRRRLRELGAEG